MKIKAVILCKKKSQRLKNKNTRRFLNYKFGLLELKIKQLIKVKKINQIIISTDDHRIIGKFKNYNKKVITLKRSKDLCNFKTKTEDLIKYISEISTDSKILWTQVSSPLVNEKIYKKAIDIYLKKIQHGYDSLMSVTAKKQFLWDKKRPINYKISKYKKWPRTQDLRKIYIINSAIFIFDQKIYKKYKDRVGKKPIFFEINEKFSIDIDNYDDFKIAEILYNSRVKL